jgi:DNA-binding beta-propeller fold protein YncE
LHESKNMNTLNTMKKQQLAIAFLLMAGAATAQQGPVTFAGRGIIALSDADLTPSALIDNNLFRERNTRDYLTTIPLPLTRAALTTTLVPNSMLVSDKGMGLTANGKIAFVLEGRGSLGDSIPALKAGLADFAPSSTMWIVDMTGPKPSVKKLTGGTNPTAIAMNPTGNNLILATGDADKELKLIEYGANGLPSRILTSKSPAPGQQITDLTFHPGGQFVAYTIAATQEIGLLKYAIDAATKKPYVLPHGKPVKVGAMPGSGKFTADGAYYVVADAKKAIGAGGTGAGEVFVLQFSTEDTPGEHKIASQAATGEAPEAVAISPDGSTVAVINAGQSYQPFGNAAAGKSSISLYSLKEGKLTLAAETPMEGVYPQAIEFDKNGDALAVGVAEYLDFGNNRNGGIEFYTVTKGDKPALTKQPGRINVARGVHALKLIP